MACVRSSRGIWAVLAVALGVGFGSRAADAEPSIETRILEYQARGTTATEVLANIQMFGPLLDGRGIWAAASWSPRWNLRYRLVGLRCTVSTVKVSAIIRISMPVFVDSAKMQPKLRRAFNGFRMRLLSHERGHERIMVATARKIEKGIRRLPLQPTCWHVRQEANALVKDLLKETFDAHRAYDERERPLQTLRFPTD